MLKDLITKNGTFRRFYQEVEISQTVLKELIDLARLSSSGANLQSLKYVISNEPAKNNLIFQHLKWAGYLTSWDGPEDGEKPSAYIIILDDKNLSNNFFWDHGIASQSILLGACERGLGGCMFHGVDRVRLRETLKIPDAYEIMLVIALGKPKETVMLEEIKENGNIKYWRDENGIHHVPKRKLEDIILEL